MTAQEILEGITRHRANPPGDGWSVHMEDVLRKLNEIEWALQALAERMIEIEMAIADTRDKTRALEEESGDSVKTMRKWKERFGEST